MAEIGRQRQRVAAHTPSIIREGVFECANRESVAKIMKACPGLAGAGPEPEPEQVEPESPRGMMLYAVSTLRDWNLKPDARLQGSGDGGDGQVPATNPITVTGSS